VTTLLGTWRAEQTTVGDVESAIARLRRQEERAAVRAAVVTLVVPTFDDHEAAAALDVLQDLGDHHPSRTIVIVKDGAGPAGIDADLRVHCIERDTRAVCFEDMVLHVRGDTARHLDSVVEPFTLPDVPVLVWLPHRLLTIDDPLLAAADRLVVDSRAAGGAAALAHLAFLADRLPVSDATWLRLAPWRRLFGGLFEDVRLRPFLDDVRAVRVASRGVARLLLAGWLTTRLGLDRTIVTLDTGEHPSVELVARAGGRDGRFAVERTGEQELRATAEVTGEPSVERVAHLGDRSLASTLGQALTCVGRDEVYEQALASALDFRR